MKKIVCSLLLLTAGAANAYTFTDQARVIKSEPIYDRVSTQSCKNVQVEAEQYTEGGNGTAGALIGGLAGGLLGHEVGGGRGKTAATIAGTIGGAMVGRHLGDQGISGTPSTRRECRQVYHDEVTGYNVTYEYRGKRNTITLPEQPGKFLEMRVSAEPVVR
jgi:uncharacterized protein YcfJ